METYIPPELEFEDSANVSCEEEQVAEKEEDAVASQLGQDIFAHADSREHEYGARIYLGSDGVVRPGPLYIDGKKDRVTLPVDESYGTGIGDIHSHLQSRFGLPSNGDTAIIAAILNARQIDFNYSMYIAVSTGSGEVVVLEFRVSDLVEFNYDLQQFIGIETESLPEEVKRQLSARAQADAAGSCTF